MTVNFHLIKGNKYPFVEASLRKAIMDSGRKKIVFVEGHDDKIIFDILYEEYSDQISFIDTSMKAAKFTIDPKIPYLGGCETVKYLLKEFVSNLHNEKRFYGVIDRDLRKDADIISEKKLPDYDGRLFVFFERYTLENYFIDVSILYTFLYRQSINHTKLLHFETDKEKAKKEITEIVDDILKCLTKIGAANLTIRLFDNSVKFLEESINCDEIEDRLILNRLDKFPENDVRDKFNEFKLFIELTNSTQKVASGKTYFSYQFKKHLDKRYKVSIQLNNHKMGLAEIIKKSLPNEFKELLKFLSVS